MNTKTCSGCGWVYPITFTPRRCKFCGTRFEEGYCAHCGLYTTKLKASNGYCRDCDIAALNKTNTKKRSTDVASYTQWIALIKNVPQPYKTLTEEQWLEACNFFKCCAFCGTPSIDARQFFIPFRDGGKYCAWNVLPACEKCATRMKLQSNPWQRYNPAFNDTYKGVNRADGYLAKMTEYLQRKIGEL